MDSRRPRVVIIGAGFGGLAAARALKRAPVDVVVLDRENYHLFQPLVYQVAMAQLAGTDISASIRAVLARQRNTRVLLGEVTSIDLDRRELTTQDGPMGYDYLIVAGGARPNYFGKDGWEAIAPSPKGLDTALENPQARPLRLRGSRGARERLALPPPAARVRDRRRRTHGGRVRRGAR